MLALVWLACLPVISSQDSTVRGAADPAYAPDGRLAVSLHGDLWVLLPQPPARWVQLTSGPATDREPAWWPDGSAVVFSSDRAGNFDLWQVRVGAGGAAGKLRLCLRLRGLLFRALGGLALCFCLLARFHERRGSCLGVALRLFRQFALFLRFALPLGLRLHRALSSKLGSLLGP